MVANRLPRLRGDLQLVSTDATAGSTLYDPLRHRYYRLDPSAAAIAKAWPDCATAAEVVRMCDDNHAMPVTEDTVTRFGQWLAQNELTDPVEEQAWRARAGVVQRQQHGWLMWLVHNYLFVKVPLLDPQRLLAVGTPWLAPLFTRTFFIGVGACGLVGLYLAGREWDRLLAQLAGFMTLQSGLLFVVALMIVKSLHELGHAATAARFGCRVTGMGVCFMVLTPMLYTDVSDAWRLPSQRQRMLVDMAGVLVEISLACISLLAWALLPEGPLKSLALILATTSLAMSLLFNCNPFMRFDGYYLLCDLVGIANLQQRSFALARWKLREWLFALAADPPESFAATKTAAMIAYAWMVWLYRLVVFTGIAIFVYAMTFKLLGIVLFVIEIVWFILLPIWREFCEWWRLRSAIVALRRWLVTVAVLAAGIAVMLIPWSTSVAVPAVLEARDISQLYPQRTAFVVETGAVRGTEVEKGALIVALASPELDQELRLTNLRLHQVRQRLERRPADAQERAQSHVLEQTLMALESKRAGLEAERAELRIVAPHAGRIVELEPNLHLGRWVRRSELVALVRGSGGELAQGYVAESDVGRLSVGAPAVFVPEAINKPTRPARIANVALVGGEAVEIPELGSPYGGSLPARWQQRTGEPRKLVAIEGQYLVSATITDNASEHECRTERGVLIAEGRPASVAARAWRHLLKVLLRESGF